MIFCRSRSEERRGEERERGEMVREEERRYMGGETTERVEKSRWKGEEEKNRGERHKYLRGPRSRPRYKLLVV